MFVFLLIEPSFFSVYSCSCPANFYGKHCEKSAWGFHDLSYMAFSSLDSSTNDISIVFSTINTKALLAYSYGPQTGGRSDFISLEIIDGHPRFSFGGGRTEYTHIDSRRYISNGKWHKITGIRNGRVSFIFNRNIFTYPCIPRILVLTASVVLVVFTGSGVPASFNFCFRPLCFNMAIFNHLSLTRI